MQVLPENCNDFQGFNSEQLEQACQHLKINAYIFQCRLDATRKKAKSAVLIWQSRFVDGWPRLNRVKHNGHLMYIKKLKSLFK